MEKKNYSITFDLFQRKGSPLSFAHVFDENFQGFELKNTITKYISDNYSYLAEKAYENQRDTLFLEEDYAYSKIKLNQYNYDEAKAVDDAYYSLVTGYYDLYEKIVESIKRDVPTVKLLWNIKTALEKEQIFYRYFEISQVTIDTTRFEEKYSKDKVQQASKFDENILKRKKYNAGVLCSACNSQDILVLNSDIANEQILVACKNCGEQWYAEISAN